MVVYSMDDREEPLMCCRQVTLNKLAGPRTTHRQTDRQTYVCMDVSCSLISITRRNAAPTLGYCCRLAVASCTTRVISSTTRHGLLSNSHYACKLQAVDCIQLWTLHITRSENWLKSTQKIQIRVMFWIASIGLWRFIGIFIHQANMVDNKQ